MKYCFLSFSNFQWAAPQLNSTKNIIFNFRAHTSKAACATTIRHASLRSMNNVLLVSWAHGVQTFTEHGSCSVSDLHLYLVVTCSVLVSLPFGRGWMSNFNLYTKVTELAPIWIAYLSWKIKSQDSRAHYLDPDPSFTFFSYFCT